MGDRITYMDVTANRDVTSLSRANLQGRFIGVYRSDLGGDATKHFQVVNDATRREFSFVFRNPEQGLDEYGTMYHKEAVDEMVGVHLAVGVERWHGTYTDENGVTYQVYSNVVKIDALPSTAGITQYPHGIKNIQQILSVYGFTTDGFVLNAPRQNAQDNISIYQVGKSNTTGSIAIEVGKDRSSKQAYVCLVYAKKN